MSMRELFKFEPIYQTLPKREGESIEAYVQRCRDDSPENWLLRRFPADHPALVSAKYTPVPTELFWWRKYGFSDLHEMVQSYSLGENRTDEQVRAARIHDQEYKRAGIVPMRQLLDSGQEEKRKQVENRIERHRQLGIPPKIWLMSFELGLDVEDLMGADGKPKRFEVEVWESASGKTRTIRFGGDERAEGLSLTDVAQSDERANKSAGPSEGQIGKKWTRQSDNEPRSEAAKRQRVITQEQVELLGKKLQTLESDGNEGRKKRPRQSGDDDKPRGGTKRRKVATQDVAESGNVSSPRKRALEPETDSLDSKRKTSRTTAAPVSRSPQPVHNSPNTEEGVRQTQQRKIAKPSTQRGRSARASAQPLAPLSPPPDHAAPVPTQRQRRSSKLVVLLELGSDGKSVEQVFRAPRPPKTAEAIG